MSLHLCRWSQPWVQRGRDNQPRAAEQSAPPSAAACIAGRKTGRPLYGAAAPGGGGRAGLGAIELSLASQDTELTPMGIIFLAGRAVSRERERERCGLVGGGGVPCPIPPCKMRK